MIFLGDSITAFLATAEGRPAFNRHYANLNAGIVAVSGDASVNTLWLLNTLPKITPKVVILLTGANDTRCNLSPATTAANTGKIISFVQANWQGARILLIPTLPRDSDPEAVTGAGLERRFAHTPGVKIVSMRDLFYNATRPLGLRDDVRDRVHPTAEKQEAMAARLGPVIERELRQSSASD
ncbi:hypothetical protein HHL08_23515 [Sphingobium sp. AR-3-1]|uniref:SGNH hydrolase-type esterase domain-containing protein n=1 Tax=Sphingobium psychrophilum TaxID=2728834 RepID=A0A7X9ZUB5_9SPHN|nr:hypothetical protein [Sphingobium psychrophilum]